MPERMVAATGVLVPALTRLNSWNPGKRWSRDIAQVRRVSVMKMTRPQAKMENVTSTRKMSPTTEPSVLVTISATGVAEPFNDTSDTIDEDWTAPEARFSAMRKMKPTMPLSATDDHIAVGTTRCAS